MARTHKTEPANGCGRPTPPAALLADDLFYAILAPAPELGVWAQEIILSEDGPLHNPDHAHLLDADICFLWASSAFAKRGRTVVGQAEQVMIRAGGWQKARQEQQLIEWFGHVPDFLITLGNAPFLVLDGPEFSATQAAFDGDDAARIAKIRKGEKVLLVCYGGGIVIGSPMLMDCRFPDSYRSEVKEKVLGAIRHPEKKEFGELGLLMGALLSVSEARLGEKTKCGIDQKACDKELSALNKSKTFDQEVKKKAEDMRAGR